MKRSLMQILSLLDYREFMARTHEYLTSLRCSLRAPRLVASSLIVLGAFLLAACGTALTVAPTPTPTRRPPVMPLNKQSWILVDLPPDATQLQHGAEIYRLVCSACHAYSGEGLTDAWRATWDPKDQNCWQSKCHGANHPPDGFVLPIAPAIVGRAALAPFQTAADLRDYIQATMPWHNPNSLTEDEGWAVTAYVLKLNRMNPPTLSAENAVQYSLHP
jgi:mono/diheme cytochrome c family protein